MVGRIPQEFLDQLLGQVDLVEIINSRVPLRRAGREFTACCPFHAEKTPSFSVSPHKQFYYCFGCSAYGNAIGFLMAYERLEFPEAVEELARQAGLELPKTDSDGASIKPLLLEVTAKADQFFRHQLRQHSTRQRAVDYLRQRGLTGQTANLFGIGYAPPGWDYLSGALREAGCVVENLITAGLVSRDEQGRLRDRFRDRVIFPIRDRRGRVIAFGGRVISSDITPKYLNSPETLLFHKGSELYGLYEARLHNRTLSRLVIVEGYMDVVALAQHNITYVVATLGTATSAAHIERLFRTVSELVFCFDGDRAGRAAAWRALEVALPFLSDGRQVNFLFLPEGQDPDTLIRREGHTLFEQRLGQATPLADYLFAELRRQTNPETLAGRARLASLAQPLLEKLPDGHFRDLMDDRLKKETQLSATRLRPLSTATGISRADRNLRLAHTPLRKAIALLLHQPELAQRITGNDLHTLRNSPGLGERLLASVAATLHAHPQLTVAALLERYRNTRESAILDRLATWEPGVPEQNYRFDLEFDDILALLRRRSDPREQLPEMLLRWGTPRALSVEQRTVVRNLSKPQKV